MSSDQLSIILNEFNQLKQDFKEMSTEICLLKNENKNLKERVINLEKINNIEMKKQRKSITFENLSTDIIKQFDNYNDIRPNTIKNHKTRIKKMKQFFPKIDFINDFKTFEKELLNMKLKLGTIKGYFATLSRVIHTVDPANKKLTDRCNEIMQEIGSKTSEKSNEKTDKDIKNWMSWSNIIKKRNQFLKQKNKNLQEQTDELLISLYTFIEPRRNCWLHLRLLQKSDDQNNREFNYYDFENKKLIINNYKTVKKFGRCVFDLSKKSPELMNILDSYVINVLLENKDNVFFRMRDGNPVTKSSQFTKKVTAMSTRVLQKEINSTLFRKIYSTDILKEVTEKSEQSAKNMGHSVGTRQKYYIKK